MNKVLKYLKRVVVGIFILYGYNLIAVNFNMSIPINLITIFGVALLGSPALIAIILLKLVIM